MQSCNPLICDLKNLTLNTSQMKLEWYAEITNRYFNIIEKLFHINDLLYRGKAFTIHSGLGKRKFNLVFIYKKKLILIIVFIFCNTIHCNCLMYKSGICLFSYGSVWDLKQTNHQLNISLDSFVLFCNSFVDFLLWFIWVI